MHASVRGMGLVVRVPLPLGLSCWARVRRAEWLPLRRVVVLVSAVQKAWSKEVFLVGSGGLCAWTSCNIFLITLHQILFTFLCLTVHSYVYQYRPSFVRRSSGTSARLPRGGYDPEEASRHMAE